MLPKYLVADVDDTFTVGGCLHPQVIFAVQRAAFAGIEVILNTGRSAGYGATLLAYVDGISAVIVENGGAWFDLRGPAQLPVEQGREQGRGHGRDETPVRFYVSPPPDLRKRLEELCERVAQRAGLRFRATADNAYRLTDYTVVRDLPASADATSLLAALAEHVRAESNGQGSLLASSIQLHFMLDGACAGAGRRSKADGVAALLRSRGVADADAELRTAAVAVGDSANDASLFASGRFALSAGVRNIERYLPELGRSRPRHITRASEGHGLIELIDDLLYDRLPWR